MDVPRMHERRGPRGLRRPVEELSAAYDEAGDASVLSLGAVLSAGAVLWAGLSIGVSDSVVVPLVLPLLPQAAALSAASPRRSAKSVFRMGTSLTVSDPWKGPIWAWSAGPHRLGWAAPLRRRNPRPAIGAGGDSSPAVALR